ncbi:MULTISPECIES: HdeD family acid-resistance protein [Streptomyces]|uniref:HdeD family acid-resistance protein n=1 Tax=Streptomyces gibsoniae TaxID=3075529 RepID=A0ABU2TUA1_9ACTN|nr:HdeD family acid-resistance protein [Streptomyces sp. DSM 41699]MDT0464543.1 HdeD family acid-resistance protein [Streptomyces sp. DSM 41699]
MTDAPSGSPWGSEYDDRHVHAGRDPHAQRPLSDGLEPPVEGVLHLLSRTAWQVVLATGVASLILGILILVWPGPSLLAAGILFGLYLIVSGVLQVASAFGTHRATSLRVLGFLSGALSIVLGLFCFRGPLESILLLALWIGIGWLFRGIAQTVAAAHDPAVPARGWQAVLGIVTFVAGVVLIVSPFHSIAVLTLVAGWWLIVVGIVELITAFRLRSRAERIPHTV